MDEIRQSAGSIVNQDIAYLLGVYLGDGSVYTNKKRNNCKQFSLEVVDRDFAEEVRNVSERVINRSIRLIVRPRSICKNGFTYRVRFGDYAFCSWLERVTSNKLLIPNLFPPGKTGILKRFLEGILDSEGYVMHLKDPRYFNGTFYKMGIAMSTSIVDQIVPYMKVFGIKMTQRRVRSNKKCKFFIEYIISIKDFAKSDLHLSIKRKQDRLETYKNYTSSETAVTMRKHNYTANRQSSEDTVQTALKDAEIGRNTNSPNIC